MGYGNRTCLDAPGGKKNLRKPVGLYPCHNQGGNQVNNLTFLPFRSRTIAGVCQPVITTSKIKACFVAERKKKRFSSSHSSRFSHFSSSLSLFLHSFPANRVCVCRALQVANPWSGLCIDSAAKPEDMHTPLGIWPCHQAGGNQVFSLSPSRANPPLNPPPTHFTLNLYTIGSTSPR